MVDVLNEFILSSVITNRKSSEPDFAIGHLADVKDIIDLEKTINIYDRCYGSK
jgi:hypothetical protein